MLIDLPFPHDALWPNKRAHWGAKSREAKKHRKWAAIATREAIQGDTAFRVGDGPYPVKIIVYSKPYGPHADADNVVAASKSLLDGIADALGVNDRHFKAPTVEFAETREGRFVVEVLG